MILWLPWPPTECRPNFMRANHWSKYSKKRTLYGNICWGLALEGGWHMPQWPGGDIHLVYEFWAPKGCRWDDDAKESAFKTGQDGLARAMGVDDKHLRVTYRHETSKTKQGSVVVRTQNERYL